jgi:alpha-L-arabinofuranosidase
MLYRMVSTLVLVTVSLSVLVTTGAQAQQRMVINADAGRDTINRHIYGHFAEHLGRGIYDGIWTRAGTGDWHLREDVIQALRQIRIPNLRWPGGCFADYYHWRDGIGPRQQRPTMVNTIWGGVTEDNSFGIHEFMDLVERLGTDPIIVGNVGSGTVQEMADWWEYMNHPGGSSLAELRRANGRAEPWNVRFWGVGNESWGCGGEMRPEFYADLYRQFQTFLRPIGQTRAFRIATGPNVDMYNWTEVMMREAGRFINGLDLHYYTYTGTWQNKGRATVFTEAEWLEALQRAMRMDELITRHSTIMDRYDPAKRVWLIVGEWGTWHQVEPGTNPGFLYQQNALRDALVASVTLDIFNKHADRVKMANLAQTVNVLQAVILTQGEQMILTPTFHVFDFYTVHHDAVALPITLDAGTYEHGGRSIPALSASASRNSDGRIHVTMTNMDPNRPRTVNASLRGQRASRVSGRILTANEMNAHNSFEQPNRVRPAAFDGARISGETLTVQLPPKSIVVLELQ